VPAPVNPSGRSLLVAASYVVLRRADEVLLQLRRGTGYMDGCWASLAGHVDPYESAVDAAVREAREEAGVEIRAVDLRPLTTLHRVEVGGPPVEQRCDFFFEVTRWTGEPTVLEPAKCAAMRWFALDALPIDVVPHERLVLDGLAAGDLPPVVSLRRAPP
jgi:8-oxo-dGTP diphosphatase